jgi:lysyl-tRNA synthetase class 2
MTNPKLNFIPDRLPNLLQDRAKMLAAGRAFFAERGVLEVDCCALGQYPAIDSNIDVIPAEVAPFQIGYLHTSPEYAMKRLLAQGVKDIYYLGHVFRQGEIGRLHSPEFTMAEWYRLGFSFEQMIEETCDFIQLFLPHALKIRKISYREAFEQYAGVNYSAASIQELHRTAARFDLTPDSNWQRDTLIHFILTHIIEPCLGREELTILTHYPPHEAALACVVEKNGELVAERFEAYHQGVELCNGYHELADDTELRRRFREENATRVRDGKPAYALDEAFLSSLGSSFPDCCGVSVGVDRLLFLRHKVQSLAEVLPFAWRSS